MTGIGNIRALILEEICPLLIIKLPGLRNDWRNSSNYYNNLCKIIKTG